MHKKFVLTLTSAILSLFILEGVLRLVTNHPNNGRQANRIDDDWLDYRQTSKTRGIDQHGFRNPKALSSADIVTLGDSHTYGLNVESMDSWPQQLGSMCNKSVYNFGISGYGFLQYYHLLDEALALQPEIIVIGAYLPNDLRDVSELFRSNERWQNWAAERGLCLDSFMQFDTKRRQRPDTLLYRTYDVFKTTAVGSIIQHKKNHLKRTYFPSFRMKINHPLNPSTIVYGSTEFKNSMLNLEEPAIYEALEISKTLLREVKERCDKQGVALGFAILPSQERAYYAYLQEQSFHLRDVFYSLMARETKMAEELIQFCAAENIPCVDTQPYVQAALGEATKVYPKVGETHPDFTGYTAYARAIHERIITPLKL